MFNCVTGIQVTDGELDLFILEGPRLGAIRYLADSFAKQKLIG